jgi:hypothetical protein
MNGYAAFSKSLNDDIALEKRIAALRPYAPMRMGQSVFTKSLRLQPQGAAVMKRPLELPLTTTTWSDATALVTRALSDTRFDFRPLERIAEETGLATKDALAALEEPGVARRPWGRPASSLFAPADKPVSSREVFSMARSFVAKRA